MILQNSCILYIGKAKNLKNRIASYLNKADTRTHIINMMRIVTHIEYKVMQDEQDALITESNLIKKHSPRFNIKMKYSNSIYYITIDMSKTFPLPSIVSVENVHFSKNYINIGPFHNQDISKKSLQCLLEFFKIKICSRTPCINCQLNKCSGLSKKKYTYNLKKFIKTMFICPKSIDDKLKKDHKKACKNLMFEYAEQLHRAESLIQVANKTTFESKLYSGNIDIILYKINEQKECTFHIVEFSGYCTLIKAHQSTYSISNIKESFMHILNHHHNFHSRQNISAIVISEEILDLLEEDDKLFISNIILKYFPICTTHSSAKKRCFSIAEAFTKANIPNKDTTCNILEKLLNFNKAIEKVSCVDIAHFGGRYPRGSIVEFNNNSSLPSSSYTKSISAKNSRNDTGAIYELLYSLFIDDKSIIPDLLIVDGGVGQLNAAIRAKKEAGLTASPFIISISKHKGNHSYKLNPESIHTQDGQIIKLSPKSKMLFIIQYMRDLAHLKAKNSMLSNMWRKEKMGIFSSIKGIGTKYRQRLVDKFTNLSEIAQYTPEILHGKTKIPINLCKQIIMALNSQK